jgi:hypothetical protein
VVLLQLHVFEEALDGVTASIPMEIDADAIVIVIL